MSELAAWPDRTGRRETHAESSTSTEDPFGSLLAIIRRFKWSIAAFTLLGFASGVAFSMLATPVYQVNTTFFADGPAAGDGALETDQYVSRRINSYIGVVESDRVADIVIEETGLDLSRSAVAERISASVDDDTVLLRVQVRDTSQERALTIAQALNDNLASVLAGLEGNDAESEIRLTAISGPQLASAPVSPRTRLNAAVGLLAGLMLGLVQAVLRGQTDRTFRSRSDLDDEFQAPVLAVIPYDRRTRKSPVLTDRQTRTGRAEIFRHLRTNLRFLDATHPSKVVIVTSAVENEGKTSCAANLAVTFALAGDRVLLMDCDLRRPGVGKYLDIESDAGLTNALADKIPVEQLIQSWPRHGLDVLASGPVPPNPAELLGSERMVDLLSNLRSDYDVIIIDTPPLLPVTDAAVLARQTDGVLLAVRHGSTNHDQVRRCLETLANIDVRVFGMVLTMSRSAEAQMSSSYYQRQRKR